MKMEKKTHLLVLAALVMIGSPAMAQTPQTSGLVVGKAQNGQAQVPQPTDGNVNWKGVGIGAGTVAGNVLYVPAKLVYGILGGITGGASYLLTGGNTQTANTIWRSSLGGDYVLTPDMVSGQKPIHFSGPTLTVPAAEQSMPSNQTTGVQAPSSAMPARTASSNIGSSTVNSAPISGDSTMGGSVMSGSSSAQPADRGTGPVSSSSTISGSTTAKAPSGVPVAPLPGTSIE